MENVMMNSIRTQIKIVDFGLSNLYDPNNPLRTHCGSPEYAAPELFVPGKCYGSEVDLWSLGVILYGMVIGQLPFVTVREETMTSKERRRKLLVQINKGYTAAHRKSLWFTTTDFRMLISKMLITDSLKRITLSELIHHPWVTDKGRKIIIINPLKRLDENWQISIMKQVGTLADLDWTTVKYAMVTDPHGDLAGMYNILAYKLQTQQLQGDIVTRNISHTVNNLNINNAIATKNDINNFLPKRPPNKKYAEVVKSTTKLPATVAEPRATTAKAVLDSRPPKIKKESRDSLLINKYSDTLKSAANKVPKVPIEPKTSRGLPIKRMVPISRRPQTTLPTSPSKCVRNGQQIDSHVLELNLSSKDSDGQKSNTTSKDQFVTPPSEGLQNTHKARTVFSAGQKSPSTPTRQLRFTQKAYTPRVRNSENMKNEVCVIGSRGIAHALQCQKTSLKTNKPSSLESKESTPSPRVTRASAAINMLGTPKSKSEPTNNGRRLFTPPATSIFRPLKRNRVIPVMGSPSTPSKGSSDFSALQLRNRRVLTKPAKNNVEVSPYALGDAYKRRATTTPAKHAPGPRSILVDPIARSIAGYIANNIPEKVESLYRFSQNGKKDKSNKLSASPANVRI